MDDADLQQAVLEELEFEPRANAGHVGVAASSGVVTLTGDVSLRGEVEYPYQRTDAEEAVRYVPGVRGVVNEITVRPLIKSHAVEQEINDAFQRNALLDARQITVTVSDGTAHLSGHVQ